MDARGDCKPGRLTLASVWGLHTAPLAAVMATSCPVGSNALLSPPVPRDTFTPTIFPHTHQEPKRVSLFSF